MAQKGDRFKHDVVPRQTTQPWVQHQQILVAHAEVPRLGCARVGVGQTLGSGVLLGVLPSVEDSRSSMN